MTLYPRKAEFREFVVIDRGSLLGGGYDVRIHENLAYLFSDNGRNDGTRPGWLGAIKFNTYDEAVEFGQRLAPVIQRAHEHYGCWQGAAYDLVQLISRKHGELGTEGDT